MPNFYVEVLTISHGKVHTAIREVIVPPEKRVINVAVKPSSATYKPGQAATVELSLTDGSGEPIVGSVAMTMYDKSLEYISGGSNVSEIREFFWKWRRNHSPNSEVSAGRWFYNLLKSGDFSMQTLGAFGDLAEVEFAGLAKDQFGRQAGEMKRKGAPGMNFRAFGMGGGGGPPMPMAALMAVTSAMLVVRLLMGSAPWL